MKNPMLLSVIAVVFYQLAGLVHFRPGEIWPLRQGLVSSAGIVWREFLVLECASVLLVMRRWISGESFPETVDEGIRIAEDLIPRR